MVRVLKFLAYLLFFMLMLSVTFPKANVLYKAQELLLAYQVKFVPVTIRERALSLEIESMSIAYKGIRAVELAQTEISLFGVYNSIAVKDLRLVGIVKNFIPSKIASAHISYSILDPFAIKAEAEGDFGKADISYLLKEKRVAVALHPSALMQQQFKSSLSLFKKSKDGVYHYEKSL